MRQILVGITSKVFFYHFLIQSRQWTGQNLWNIIYIYDTFCRLVQMPPRSNAAKSSRDGGEFQILPSHNQCRQSINLSRQTGVFFHIIYYWNTATILHVFTLLQAKYIEMLPNTRQSRRQLPPIKVRLTKHLFFISLCVANVRRFCRMHSCL